MVYSGLLGLLGLSFRIVQEKHLITLIIKEALKIKYKILAVLNSPLNNTIACTKLEIAVDIEGKTCSDQISCIRSFL